MAILTKPLYIKDGSTVYECSCYTVESEAVPVTQNKGTGMAWEMKNNNTTCYVGLWPTEATNTPRKRSDDSTGLSITTPLTIVKGGKTYNAMRYTFNVFDITVKATSNQKITFTYYDTTNTKQSIDVTSSDKTVTALAGTEYTCTITANTGYTKGGIQGASAKGYVNSTMTVSATAATINSYVMTVVVPTGATITVGSTTYTAGTSTVTYNYNTSMTISCASTADAQYSVSGLTAGGNAIISGSTYKMPASAVTVTCTATVRSYTITVTQGTGTTLTVKDTDVNVPNGSSVKYGTLLTYTSSANTGYESVDVKVGG